MNVSISQDIGLGTIGAGATVTTVLGYVAPVLGVIVALLSGTALVYGIILKRRQIAALDK